MNENDNDAARTRTQNCIRIQEQINDKIDFLQNERLSLTI